MKATDREHRKAEGLLREIATKVRAELRASSWAPLRVLNDTVDRTGDPGRPGFGWWTQVALPRPRSLGTGAFTLFLETCIGDPERLALGCWYRGTKAAVRKVEGAVALAWDVESLETYADGDQTDGRSPPRPGIHEPFIDHWNQPSTQYVGLYVARSPTRVRLSVLVRDSVKSLLRLAEAVAASPTTAKRRSGRRDWDGERARATRTVLSRPHQAYFRAALVEEWKSCVITGESCRHALEGAHIDAVKALGTDDPTQNGLLLRADLHLLFDRGLLTIVPGPTVRVAIAESVSRLSEAYRDLEGPIACELGVDRAAALRRRNRALGWVR